MDDGPRPARLRTEVDGLAFDPPAGFRRESTTVCLRVPPERGFAEPPLAGPVRPSLVVTRRPASPPATLARCASAATEQLVRAIPGLRGVEAVDVRFEDGVDGVLLAYSFPAPRVPDIVLCQLQALRLDGETLSSLTLTTTLAQLTGERRDQLVRILASARLAGAAPPAQPAQPA